MKNSNSLLLLFGCLSLFSACEDEQEDMVRDTTLEISFSDKNGNDLLNPAQPASFDPKNIDLFYLKDKQLERVNNGNMDAPEGFFVFKAGAQHLLRLFPSEYAVDGKTTSYLQLSQTDMDTVICELNKLSKSGSSTVVTKVWFNGRLMWNGEGPRYFDVKK